jgi:type IV pilus assembly protein PilA
MIKLNNKKGFTLIELMIVIAIIGILAAIAIPNFIEYRNKSFCSKAESDANNVAAIIADYFAIPTHTSTPIVTGSTTYQGYTLSGPPLNTVTTTETIGANGAMTITIAVTDSSTRCPAKYKASNPEWSGNTITKSLLPTN